MDKFKHIFIALMLLGLTACDISNDDSATLENEENSTPVAIVANSFNAEENTQISLNGSASSDSDGTITSYIWIQTSGIPTVTIIDPTLSISSFNAPDVTTNTILTFELTVTDNNGASNSSSVVITITPQTSVNQLPVAIIPNNFNAVELTQVSLDSSASLDSDGTITDYLWIQTAGTPSVVLSDSTLAVTSFIAPNINVNTPLTFEITVTDNDGDSNTNSLVVTIIPQQAVNQPPIAVTPNSFNAIANTQVGLVGNASSDTDGTINNYSWVQSDGLPVVSLTDSSLANASFTAPDISSNTQLTFELTVTDNDGDSNSSSVVVTITPPVTSPIIENVRNYIFGHSLILHLSDDLTNVPRWLHELSLQAGYTYSMSGQYGFEDTHATDLPPGSQWGIPQVTPIWDEDIGQTFSDTNFNTILFTAANFRQYYPPTAPEPDGFVPISAVDNTITVFDWVEQAEPGVRYLIYENWPDMGPFTNADFSTTFPSSAELLAYYNFTRGDFHDWWIDYQDTVSTSRPGLEVRMIPVGPILASLLTGTLSDVPASALYEDSAPHGRATLYFLAGLVTYMSMYGVEAPANFVVPNTIDIRVRTRYTQITSEIWTELQRFNDLDGNSRVFPN